jgi:shikimate 5-dehydrogenase
MGFMAVALSTLFLAFLLFTMLGQGLRGFQRTEIAVEFDFPALTAGATAASLTLAALDFSDHVSVTNRNDARTDELIKRDWPKKVHKVLWEDREKAAKESGLIVNTTSVGLVNDDSPLRYWPENSSADLYDLIYRPKLTMIQEQAKASSGVVVDGLSHLQGHIEATMNVLGISLADPRALHNIMSDIAGRPPLRWEKP